VARQDCVLIVTDHSAFDYDLIAEHAKLIVDTRNATANCAATACRIVKA
jgi:UDP-N-acetyl-D-glucosamine dehydrogenase